MGQLQMNQITQSCKTRFPQLALEQTWKPGGPWAKPQDAVCVSVCGSSGKKERERKKEYSVN